MKWTDEQIEVIGLRGCNLLVSAGAGSGKTAVLVQRIIDLVIKDKIDIDRILVVTFTNAAAGEMKERIHQAIMAELNQNGENTEYLRRQLKLMNRAFICTLHSFCNEVVRKHFHLLGIDPGYRIGDMAEVQLLKSESVLEVFEAEYRKAEPFFLSLVEMFCNKRDDTPLQELVMEMYDFIQSKPYPFSWLKAKVKEYSLDPDGFESSSWAQAMKNQISTQLLAAREVFQTAMDICCRPGGPVQYQVNLNRDINIIDHLIASLEKGFTYFAQQLAQTQHTRLVRINEEIDEALKKGVQDLRNEGKELLKQVKNHYLPKMPDVMVKEMNYLYPVLDYLVHILISFEQVYREKKLERGIVDFNDIEHYALTVLENPEASNEYQQMYLYIFVDEYQDTNSVQDTILSMIKGQDNLFMVGDVKQSIYRFRLAEPSIFIKKYHEFSSCQGQKNRRIDLNTNFRSCDLILNGVNFLFQRIMSANLGEIDYNESCFLKPPSGKTFDSSPIELCILDNNRVNSIDDDWGDSEKEALYVARKIMDLVGQPIYDHKRQCCRKIEYRDITVLLRTMSNSANIFTEKLISQGIPVYADVANGYFDTVEVKILMNLLRLISNKRQDIPLISIMRSPLFHFSIEDLALIRIKADTPSYFEAVEKYSLENQDELAHRLNRFIEQLSLWKNQSRYMPLDELIWKILIDSGFYYLVNALPGGAQRQANLRMFCEKAREFQKTSLKGIYNFIRYMEKIENNRVDMGLPKYLGENNNAVRLMSIHKSKGLEFPVVIIAGLGKQFNFRDISSPLLFHRDLGVGARYIDTEPRMYIDTIPRRVIKNQIRIESLSEEMRILYVGMTRAEGKLILVGTVPDIASKVSKWAKPLSVYNLVKAKNFLDWIGPAVMRHQDGECLRELADGFQHHYQVMADNSKWQVNVVCASGLNKDPDEFSRLSKEELLNYTPGKRSDEYPELIARLSWEYPFAEATKVPSKIAVTHLTDLQTNLPNIVTMPRFMVQNRRLSAAEKGSIIHFVMQYLDFKRATSTYDIKSQLENMVNAGLLDREAAETVNEKDILNFCLSDLGKRVCRADKVYREIPFNYLCPANEVFDGLVKCNERLLLQGIIDLYFYEDGQIVLVDYKTGHLLGDHERVPENYKTQMKLYKNALENILGDKVKEAYIYKFNSNQALPV
ncbi:MAG: helicase-exonuclease AddAB subunit AddA [Syntrophomonadaceae bacterium]